MACELSENTQKTGSTVSIPDASDMSVLFGAMPGAHIVLQPNDPAFTILAVSDDYLRFGSAKREQVIGRDLSDVYPDHSASEAAGNLLASLRRAIATRATDHIALQRYDMASARDGAIEERYWTVTSKPVTRADGSIFCVLQTTVELTAEVMRQRSALQDTKRAEKALERATRSNDEILETITDGFMVLDRNWCFLYANPAAERIVGATRKELLGQNYWELFPATIGTRTETEYKRAVREKVPVELEMFHEPRAQWFAVKAYPAPEGGLSIYFKDITARKEAERRLFESKEQLRAIYDTTREHVGLLTADGTVLEANRASLEFAGSTLAEVVNRPFWEGPWFAFTPGASETIRESVRRAASGELVQFEATFLRPDGDAVTFDVSFRPIRDEKGEVTLIVPEGRDVSRHKAIEKRDSFLLGLDDALRPLDTPDAIPHAIARIVGKFMGADDCVYALFDEGEGVFVPAGTFSGGTAPAEPVTQSLARFGRECLRRLRSGERLAIENRPDSPALLIVPLMNEGRITAALLLGEASARNWRHEETELLHLVLSRSWESIERARITRELVMTERWLRLAQRSARIGNFDWRLKTGELIWTPEMEMLYGLAPGTFEGNHDSWYRRVVREDADRIMAGIGACRAGREAEFMDEFRAIMPDGSHRWRRVQAQFIYGPNGEAERLVGATIDIDERKQSEAVLRRQWQTFDTALTHVQDFIYTFDLQGRFTYVNRPLLTLLELELDQALGKTFLELKYPAELAARLQRQIEETAASRRSVRDQTPFTGPTGETRHYEYVFVPVIGASGKVEAVAGSTRDITDRRNAEERILADRRRWRDLLKRAPAAVAVLRGPELRYDWVNEEFCRFSGRTIEEVIGRPLQGAFAETASQSNIPLFFEAYRSGQPVSRRESRIVIGRPPRELFVNFLCIPTRDSEGQVDGVFIHTVDVTDIVSARKRAEESEARYRFLADSIPQMVWTCAPDGVLDYVSSQLIDYVNLPAEEISRLGWLHFVHPDEREAVAAQWEHCRTTGELFQSEFRFRRSDREWRWLMAHAQCLAIDGNSKSWVGTFTEIHQQKENEAALRRANRELEEFAYVAGHDLQEPLRAVNIYSELLALAATGDYPAAETPGIATINQYATFVRHGVTRMHALIEDLLDYSRTLYSEAQPGCLAELEVSFHDAVSVLRNRLDESGAEVQCGSLPRTTGDTGQITRVFQNLISNAIKYRRPEVPPIIQVDARLLDDSVIVSVRDNGIGFEQQYAERVFGLFKRLHSHEYLGTGLGLAICRRIVEKYGGRIWAESIPGEGTTISFSLPLPVNATE